MVGPHSHMAGDKRLINIYIYIYDKNVAWKAEDSS